MNEGMKMLIRVNVNCSLLNWPFYLKQREGNKKKVWRKKKGCRSSSFGKDIKRA